MEKISESKLVQLEQKVSDNQSDSSTSLRAFGLVVDGTELLV